MKLSTWTYFSFFCILFLAIVLLLRDYLMVCTVVGLVADES